MTGAAMSEVIIAGIGQTPVGEHWDLSLRTLAARAIRAAVRDAGGAVQPKAMYIGNLLGSTLSHQSNLGALLAENAGLTGIEAYTIEAAGAGGAGAFRMGYLAIESGLVDAALVVGVDKITDGTGAEVESALAETQDYDYETVPGLTPTAQAGLLMRRYLEETGTERKDLGEFSLLAHANGAGNPNAMYRKAINWEMYNGAEMVCDPLNLMDVAPAADGAAALLLVRSDAYPNLPNPPVRVTGSSVVIDTLAIHDRPDPLAFEAVGLSTERACRQAGILPGDVDFFEVCDTFSIYAALSLEAAGFAQRGEAPRLAREGVFSPTGRLPILTMGGGKARGNPLGALGVYQLAEAALQLRGQAGKCQLKRANRALVQTLGGPAATVVTHVLERWE